jgi:hypothetical protein
MVSGGPELRPDGGLLLSFGNLPLVPASGDGHPHTPRWLPFESWVDTWSLIVPSRKPELSNSLSMTTFPANDAQHTVDVAAEDEFAWLVEGAGCGAGDGDELEGVTVLDLRTATAGCCRSTTARDTRL